MDKTITHDIANKLNKIILKIDFAYDNCYKILSENINVLEKLIYNLPTEYENIFLLYTSIYHFDNRLLEYIAELKKYLNYELKCYTSKDGNCIIQQFPNSIFCEYDDIRNKLKGAFMGSNSESDRYCNYVQSYINEFTPEYQQSNIHHLTYQKYTDNKYNNIDDGIKNIQTDLNTYIGYFNNIIIFHNVIYNHPSEYFYDFDIKFVFNSFCLSFIRIKDEPVFTKEYNMEPVTIVPNKHSKKNYIDFNKIISVFKIKFDIDKINDCKYIDMQFKLFNSKKTIIKNYTMYEILREIYNENIHIILHGQIVKNFYFVSTYNSINHLITQKKYIKYKIKYKKLLYDKQNIKRNCK